MRFLTVLMLSANNDVTPEHGVPTTRAVTEIVSRYGEATTVDMNVHTKGNDNSTPVFDEGGCCKTHMQDSLSVTAPKQWTRTGEVSLRPDSAASQRRESENGSHSVDGPSAANCVRTCRFLRERAWHEHDDEHDHVWLDIATMTCSNHGNNSAHDFRKTDRKSVV